MWFSPWQDWDGSPSQDWDGSPSEDWDGSPSQATAPQTGYKNTLVFSSRVRIIKDYLMES